LVQVGGSNAQQDVFHQTYIDILLKTNRLQQAEPLVAAKVQAKNIEFDRERLQRIRSDLLLFSV
jgi:hypothetical protein